MNTEKQESKKSNKVEEINEDMINLVVARLEALPSNVAISIGANEGAGFSSEELIKSVRERDDLGKKIVRMQLEYIRSFVKPLQENVVTNH